MEILDYLSPLNTILLCLMLFIFFVSYKFILVPYLKFIRVRKEIKGKYQAYQYPFTPYGFSFMLKLVQDFKQYGDSLYLRKHILPRKDITISAMRDQIMINLIDNKLIHEFVERQKEGYYAKVKNAIHISSLFQILGTGLLLSEGQEWRYKRKIMSTLFNFQFIKQKTQSIIDISKQMCQDVAKEKKENGEVEIEVVRLFQKIFGTVVIKCFFGDIKLQPINGKNIFEFLSELFQKIVNRNFMISSFILSPFLKNLGIRKVDRQINLEISMFRAYVKQVIDHIIKSINQRTFPKDSQGLIAKLLRNKQFVQESTQQQKNQKGLYTYEDLINQMCTFFFAGTDTTSSVIGSLIHMLARRIDVQQKLRDQIKTVINDDIANINLESIKKMPYLKCVQSEILRVATSAPNLIPREALKDHKIGDITISKGTIVNVEILSNQYKEDIFEKPFQFIPERWQKLQNEANIGKIYFPFSLGLRSCIGQQLALIESRIAVVIFMLYFKNGRELQPQRNKFGLTYGPYQSKMLFQSI